MNLYSQFSMLAMVTAAIIYLLAVFAHAAEWASARHAVAPVERKRRGTRTLVAAGAATKGTSGSPVSDEASAEEQASPTADDGESDTDRLRTDKFGRIGIALGAVGCLAQVVGVVTRGLAAGRAPWGNMYEFTTSALLFIAIGYLVLATRFGMRWLGLLCSLLLTVGLGLAVTVFYVEVGPLVPALHSAWFLFHISAAAVAGAAYNIGGLASILYLIRQRAENKAIRVGDAEGLGANGGASVKGYLAKMPAAKKLDTIAYRANAFAFPLWTVVIAAGAIWAQYAWGRYWGWDPKETWSLVTWAIYAAYLHARSTAGWKGTKAAVIAIIGMVSFWWNFVGINLLVTGLHSYAK